MRRFAAALALALVTSARADVAIPPVARVADQTGTLSAAQRGALEQRLAAFEQRKGSQIAVLIVATTRPETIEQYSIRVAEAWQLGRKGVDDGLLLVLAKDDRELRIEVGYGLEGAVPDAIANRVIDEIIVPRLRDGDFYGGVSAGVDQLMHVVDGEPLPQPRRRVEPSGLQGLFVLAMFLLAASHAVGRAIGEAPSALAAGGVFGLATFGVLGSAGFGALAALLLFAFSVMSQLGGRGGGGWTAGGLGGGAWRSGGGFGGGGFSGGGGGFGGGGASGRW